MGLRGTHGSWSLTAAGPARLRGTGESGGGGFRARLGTARRGAPPGTRRDVSWARETGCSQRNSLRRHPGAGGGRSTRRRTQSDDEAEAGRWGPGERGARHGDGARLSQAGGILITPSNGWTPSADPSGHAVVRCPRALCPRRTLRLWPHARPAGPGHRGQRGREAWGADSAGSLSGSPWLAGPSGGDRCPAPRPPPYS